jgi:hypothetical protein
MYKLQIHKKYKLNQIIIIFLKIPLNTIFTNHKYKHRKYISYAF